MALEEYESLLTDYDVKLSVFQVEPTPEQLIQLNKDRLSMIFMHHDQIKVHCYDLNLRQWRVQSLDITYLDINTLMQQKKMKLSELPAPLKNQVSQYHSEVIRQLPRLPILSLDDARNLRRMSDFTTRFQWLHSSNRSRQPHHPSDVRLQRTDSSQELSYDASKQLTNYKTRLAKDVLSDLNLEQLQVSSMYSEHFFNQLGRKIPGIVQRFNINDEHTLFMPSEHESEGEKLNKSLDIRLGSQLIGLLISYGHDKQLEAFQGSVGEMIAFYSNRQYKLDQEIQFPSTGRYYRFVNPETNDDKMVLGALQSEANLISQLLTLKKAGVDIEEIPIYGDTSKINQSIQADLSTFKALLIEKQVNFAQVALVLASNAGILDAAILRLDAIDLSREIIMSPEGSRCKMTYYPLKEGGGIINLQKPYGEVMGMMVSTIIEQLNVRRILLAGVAGSLVLPSNEDFDPIGQYYLFSKTSNHEEAQSYQLDADEMLIPNRLLNGVAVVFKDMDSELASHVHVDSPLLETKPWLQSHRERCHTVVDCETYYCFQAIKRWNKSHVDEKVKIMPGVFISDVVGVTPLVSVSHQSYNHLEPILEDFVQQIQQLESGCSFKLRA